MDWVDALVVAVAFGLLSLLVLGLRAVERSWDEGLERRSIRRKVSSECYRRRDEAEKRDGETYSVDDFYQQVLDEYGWRVGADNIIEPKP